ncbi:MAG: hypothetical protein CMP91_04615 [Gammaproteobacteria bacterium]|nr:hypothetical protein [Gammaproteobacteria bacterium]|tara:strand:- start:402679 stop:403125 length:447 start_codon:yes stop_codon:yes gene_type:complete
MTVLVEGISVIIKLEAIERVIPDGWEGFRQYVPNFAWCKDDNIVRLAFLSPEEAKQFAEKLESLKLEHWGKEGAQDFVMVDQMHGIPTRCTWLEFGHVDLNHDPEKKVAACRLAGTKDDSIVTPENWKYENSLTKEYGLTPPEQQNKA